MNANINKPDSVRNAVALLYCATGIFAVTSIFHELLLLQDQTSLYIGISIDIFWTCVSLFLICMIGKGKNWARITLLALFIIFFVAGLVDGFLELGWFKDMMPGEPSLELAVSVFYIIGLGMSVFALVLLFRTPSSHWFKEMAAARAQSVTR